MKIIHIFWSFTVGGAETMLVDIMNQQVIKNKVTLIVINRMYSMQLLSSLDDNINVVLLNRNIFGKNPIPFIKLNIFLLKLKPSVIHCHNYNLENVILNFFLRNAIVTIHGFNRQISKNNKYVKVIAISKAIEYDLKRKGLSNIDTIYNGVDVDKIKRKKYFNKNLQIVCIGRLEHKIKGQDILLNAFSLLKKGNIKAKLHFIGNGPSKTYLVDLVNKLELNNDVVFQDNIPRMELYKSIKNFDILVQPSIHEGFGLTVVEAMAAGIPVVVSKASGLLEVTNHGKYANIVEPNTPERIVEIITELKERISDYSLQKRLNEAAKYVDYNYSITKTCDNYFKLYERCLKSL